MLKLLAILSVAAVIILIEFSTLKEKKFKQNRLPFLVLLLIGIGLNVMISFKLNVPPLFDWLIIIYRPISQLVSNWLS